MRSDRLTIAAVCATALFVAGGAGLLPAAAQRPPGSFDCEGPAGDPEPGTSEWHRRDAQNQYCLRRPATS